MHDENNFPRKIFLGGLFLVKKLTLHIYREVKIESVNGTKVLFSISPADGSYKVNFGEEEFENYFKEFLRPQLVQMLF